MTKEAMARMAETMRYYRQTKKAKVLTEKWNEFFSGTGDIPEEPDDVTADEEDEDVYEEEAIVLYAELNNSFHIGNCQVL